MQGVHHNSVKDAAYNSPVFTDANSHLSDTVILYVYEQDKSKSEERKACADM